MSQRHIHRALVFGGLFAFWVVLSGKLDAVHLGMGVFSALLVTWLSSDLLFTETGRGDGRQWLSFIPWHRLLLYLPWLAWEVVKANIVVLRLVLGPRSLLRPRVVKLPCELDSELARAVMGNSITLTPGTVTLDITEGHFVVHAIDEASAKGLLEGAMQRRVAHAFGEDRKDA